MPSSSGSSGDDSLEERSSRAGRAPVRGGRAPVRGGRVPVRGGRPPASGSRAAARGGRPPASGSRAPTRGGRSPARGGRGAGGRAPTDTGAGKDKSSSSGSSDDDSSEESSGVGDSVVGGRASTKAKSSSLGSSDGDSSEESSRDSSRAPVRGGRAPVRGGRAPVRGGRPPASGNRAPTHVGRSPARGGRGAGGRAPAATGTGKAKSSSAGSSDDDSSEEDDIDSKADSPGEDDDVDRKGDSSEESDVSSDDNSSEEDANSSKQERRKLRRKKKIASDTPPALQIFSWQNVAIPIFYFVSSFTQGLLIPIMVDAPSEEGASSAQLENINTIFFLPFYFKVILAFVSDAFPNHGRRKPFIIAGWVMAIIVIISLAFLADTSRKAGDPPSADAPSVALLSTALFFYGLGSTLASVCIDAMAVEKFMIEDDTTKGRFVSACLAFRTLGFVISVPIGSVAYATMGTTAILSLLCVIPFLALFLVYPLVEHFPPGEPLSTKALARKVWDTCMSRSSYQTMGGLFAYLMFQVQFAGLNEYLEFSGINEEDINISTVLGIVAMLVGILLYRLFLLQKSWKFMLSVATILTVLTTLLYIFLISGIGGLAFVIFIKMINGLIDSLELLPVVLILSSAASLEGIEATSFAMFSTITNFAVATSQSMSVAIQVWFKVFSDNLEDGTSGPLKAMILILSFLPIVGVAGIMNIPTDAMELETWRDTLKASRGFILVGVVIMSVFYVLVVALMNVVVFETAAS